MALGGGRLPDPESLPPEEFAISYVETHSPASAQLDTSFLRSGEPYRSLMRTGFHAGARDGYGLKSDTPRGAPATLDLDDTDLYYNTGGAAADYWRGVDLPQPTREIETLRRDLGDWGYCLIADALSPAQLRRMKQRVSDQAAGERLAGVACWMGVAPSPGEALPRVQFVHTLINKGEQFIQCVEHDPAGVQAGPVIEQLLNETMGPDFLMSSFLAIIAGPYNNPQGLHQDQAIAPFQDPVAPFTVNTMYILDDTGPQNGGTLVVPGSHKLLSAAGSGRPLTEPLPPAINLSAPAGTVMIFEGRLLHGTGVNRTNASRTILVMKAVKPFMRQQELHLLSAFPEILEKGSAKLLYRLGARPTGLGGVEGAWSGEYIVGQRLAMEGGGYLRVGEVSPDSPESVLLADYGYRHSEIGRRQAPHQPEAMRSLPARTSSGWRGPDEPKFPLRRAAAPKTKEPDNAND